MSIRERYVCMYSTFPMCTYVLPAWFDHILSLLLCGPRVALSTPAAAKTKPQESENTPKSSSPKVTRGLCGLYVSIYSLRHAWSHILFIDRFHCRYMYTMSLWVVFVDRFHCRYMFTVSLWVVFVDRFHYRYVHVRYVIMDGLYRQVPL